MENKIFSPLSILLDKHEGSNLLLEYYASFSTKIFSLRDFKSVLNVFNEELQKIYVYQKIEIILWQNNRRLVKFQYDNKSQGVIPSEKFSEKDTIYNYVLSKPQIVLTNNYENFCQNLGVSTANIPAESWIGIPMKVRGKILGALVLWDNRRDRCLKLQDKQFLSSMTNMVGFAIENIYLCDYIAEKNGSYKLFDNVLPKGKTRNSIKSVLSQLLNTVVSQPKVEYSGLFLGTQKEKKWRLLGECFQEDKFSTLGLKLLNSLPEAPPTVFNDSGPLFWRGDQSFHPLTKVFSQTLDYSDVNSALLFPFVINQTYLGAWIITYSQTNDPPSHDELQMYQFFLYLITQLIEKKAILERIKRHEVYTKHLERMKVMGELASGIAHQLNNVLCVVIGKGQMLQKKLETSAQYRDLELILQAAQDGANTIRRLQNYSSQSKSSAEPLALDINVLIQEVVEIARPRFENEAQKYGIYYDLNLELGKIKPIVGDATELRDVIFNLINNALDAMPRGGNISIQTTQKENKILIFVSDTGIGIPQEIQEKIFNKFYTTKGKHGNGLGLSTAQDIIKKHKGKIYVDSVPNKGSIFMIELPATGKNKTKTTQPEFFQQLNYKVLLVEDEGIVRETLQEMLEDEGCEVTPASNAQEALINFQKYQCDVVFADLSMPNVNGIELAKKIKSQNPQIPVFIVTGWNQFDESLIKSNEIIDGVIKKPFNMELIRQEMIRVIGKTPQFQRNGFSI